MSLRHFPVPFKGEFWHGTICRLHKELGAPQSVHAFHKFLIGKKFGSIGSGVPHHLPEIFQQLPKEYPLTIQEFTEKHTLRKYFLDFTAWSGKKKPKMITHLKSCPQCRAEDTHDHGVPLWKTCHQANAVTWCCHHCTPLEITQSPVWEQRGDNRSYTASYAIPNDTALIPIENLGDKATRIHIATLIQAVLEQSTPNRAQELGGLWGELKKAKLATGFEIRGWDILKLAEEKFGEELKNVFGIERSEQGRRTLTNILNNTDKAPIKNLFYYALLDIPFGTKMEAVPRIAIEKRAFRRGKAVLTQADHKLRKQYLKEIKSCLPSEVKSSPTTIKVEAKFPKWVDYLEKSRRAKREESKAFIVKNDAKCAILIRKAADRLKAIEDKPPIWLRKTTLLRETGNHQLCIRCESGPLTAQALADCIQSKEDIINTRITWAKDHSDGVLGRWDFLVKAKLRGMQGIETIPGIVTRQIRWKKFYEDRQALISAWDEDSAKAVTRAAEAITKKKGRPEWIKMAAILRGSGDMADKIEACKTAPATKTALLAILDNRESLTKKRYKWAESHHPEIFKMTEYEQIRALGLAKGRASKIS